MSSSSAARGAGDAAPNVREQAQSRRQRVQLTGWSLGGVAVVLVLLRQLALTAHELCVLLGAVAPPALTGGARERVYSVRFSNSAAIASEKVRPIMSGIHNELKRWTVWADEREMVLNAASETLANFQGVERAVVALQESLAKSRSLGSMAGIRTYDLEQIQSQLRETQSAVGDKAAEVHALAERNVEEHKVHEEEMIALDAEGAVRLSPEREHRREALKYKQSERLAEVDLESLWTAVRDLEAWVAKAPTTKEAEATAQRYIRAARSDGSATEISDDEAAGLESQILRIVEEEVLSAGPPRLEPVEGCLSPAEAKKIARAELETYAADRTGKPDYAMAQAGGRVIKSMTSATLSSKDSTGIMGYVDRVRNVWRDVGYQSLKDAEMAISSVAGFGKCWPMRGSRGRLTVQLSEAIHVESVSLEHPDRAILLNDGVSAPKDFSVIGYRKGWTPLQATVGDVLVSNAEYSLDGKNIQDFPVAEQFLGNVYTHVTLEVESNHGEGAYTCLYRFRVHGSPS